MINVKTENKTKSYLIQFGYIIIMAFVIGFTVSSIAMGIVGTNLGIITTALFLTIVSLALMLLTNGSINLIGKKGIIIPAFLFVLGMGLIQLPYEFINSVWGVLVASWEPLRYIGIGVREVLFQNMGIWNSASISLIVIAIIGILFSIINIVKKDKE